MRLNSTQPPTFLPLNVDCGRSVPLSAFCSDLWIKEMRDGWMRSEMDGLSCEIQDRDSSIS